MGDRLPVTIPPVVCFMYHHHPRVPDIPQTVSQLLFSVWGDIRYSIWLHLQQESSVFFVCVCVCEWVCVTDKFFMYIVHCSAIYFPMSVLSSEVTCCFPGEDMHPHTYTGCWVSCIIQKTMTCNYFFNVKQKSNKCVCYWLFFSWWIAGWHYVMRVSHTFWCLLPFPHSSS